MNGDFNIAVADFTEVPSNTNPMTAPVVSQRIFSSLDSEYLGKQFAVNVELRHLNKEISGTEDARNVAELVNADIIIYGYVSVIAVKVREISPRFYISDDFRADVSEVVGEHGLELPLSFSSDELADPNSKENIALKQRISTLIEFTKGLAYLLHPT